MEPNWLDFEYEETSTNWEEKYEAEAEQADAEYEDNYEEEE